jgi:hypothetical protein
VVVRMTVAANPAAVVPMHVSPAVAVPMTAAAILAIAAARSVAACWPRCVPVGLARRLAAANLRAVVLSQAAAVPMLAATTAANPAADVPAEISG